jgi:tRNA threonylcarbamoyladenosine biosynthesis protein TsaE
MTPGRKLHPVAEHTLDVPSLTALHTWVSALSVALPRKNVRFFLSGDLGTGKTAFSKLYLACQGHQGKVLSPSFGIVISYTCDDTDIHHFDCYRLKGDAELQDLDLDLYLSDRACLLVEWPENGMDQLITPDIHLHFSHQPPNPDARQIRVEIFCPTIATQLAPLFK